MNGQDGNKGRGDRVEGELDREVERRTLAELGWPELLSQLARRCHSERGRSEATALPLATSSATIEALLALVVEGRDLHASADAPPFGEIHDVRPALCRLDKEGALAAPTLLRIAETLRSLARLARFFRDKRERATGLAARADAIDDLESVWGAIDDCFEPDGELADHASKELYDLRRRAKELHGRVTREMKTLMDSPRISRRLSDRFYTQREDRFVLPVRADAGGAVDGIVLGCSSSGATLFVEPREVVGLNNELKVAEMAVQREEGRILAELSQLVAEESVAISANLELGTELDLIDARSRLAVDLEATRPTLSTDGRLLLRAARHPLLALGGVEVVPHDVALERGRCLLISGPNAGGKTVCLKTVGLCALMVRSGMLLPVAAESVIPIYSRVLAEIGDAQSLEQNLSTFTAHVAALLAFLELVDDRALLLIDEIATGTDPGQGEALAQALLEELVSRACQLIATTHYERLKALPTLDGRFENANVGFDLAAMRPTFALHAGAPGTSFALSVASKLGLAAAIGRRAEALLDETENELSRLLIDLSAQRERLEAEHAAARQARADAADEKRRFEQQRSALADKTKRALSRAHAEGLDELKRARAELSKIRSELRRTSAEKRIDAERLRRLDRRVSVAARTLGRHEPTPEEPPGRVVVADDLAIGATVFVPRLGGPADVLAPQKKGRVEVLFGGMRTLVSIGELRLPESPLPGGHAKGAKHMSTPLPGPRFIPSSDRSADNTLDLRGQRVDDALRETDAFIDRALLEGRDIVYILHGLGTGALRSAVREHLRESPVVAESRSAERDAGGDAITVLELR